MASGNPENRDGWPVGVLFSRSGTTFVTEREHVAGTMHAIAEINDAGGVLGRPLVPVAYDPGADNDAYRALARRMLAEDEIDVIFGCSMSASRKTVLPSVERYNGLLFYPSMYEGFEYCENLVYTGSTANQICLPLADYLLANHGGRIFFVGSDYIFPRESNRVMRELIEARGGEAAGETYVPLGSGPEALAPVIDEIRRCAPDAVFSTVIGTSAHALYALYHAAGFNRAAHPIASLTMAETEIAHIGREMCEGHILASTYFQTIGNEANARFVAAFKARFGEDATTSTYSEVPYMQVHFFARALARVGATDPHRIALDVLGDEFATPEGTVRVDRDTRHLWLTPRIGVARADGLFDTLGLPQPAIEILHLTGLDRHLTDEVSLLSHGQKQSLELAMVVALEPQLILLDEPTAGLTKAERTTIGQVLQKLTADLGIAAILVEHDLDFVRDISSRIVVLHQGRLVLGGTVEEVVNDEIVKKVYSGGAHG